MNKPVMAFGFGVILAYAGYGQAAQTYPDMGTCVRAKLGAATMDAHDTSKASKQDLDRLNKTEPHFSWDAQMSAASHQCRVEMCVKGATFSFCKPPPR